MCAIAFAVRRSYGVERAARVSKEAIWLLLANILVLYSIYWVFWVEVQKKEVKKGKIIVATDVHTSSLIINSIKYTV